MQDSKSSSKDFGRTNNKQDATESEVVQMLSLALDSRLLSRASTKDSKELIRGLIYLAEKGLCET
jgi:hypothetical protein